MKMEKPHKLHPEKIMETITSLFPKFYVDLGVKELAVLVHKLELDTPDRLIRDGHPVTPGFIKKQLPAFVDAMLGEGLTVTSATAGYTIESLISDTTPVAGMADSGIRTGILYP